MPLSSHGLRAVRAIAFVTLSSSVAASLAACSSAESDTVAPSSSASTTTTTTATAAPSTAPGRDAAIAANDAGRVPEKDAAVPDAAPQDDDSGLPPGAGPLAPPEWLA